MVKLSPPRIVNVADGLMMTSETLKSPCVWKSPETVTSEKPFAGVSSMTSPTIDPPDNVIGVAPVRPFRSMAVPPVPVIVPPDNEMPPLIDAVSTRIPVTPEIVPPVWFKMPPEISELDST